MPAKPPRAEFRKLDTATPVVLITADCGDFYAKPSLSNAFAQGKLPAQLVRTPAARVLAANLTGALTELRFSLMPVSVKTPALPLVVASPSPGTTGTWHLPDARADADPATPPGRLWQWLDNAGLQRGFVLAGAHTAQRMAQSRLVAR